MLLYDPSLLCLCLISDFGVKVRHVLHHLHLDNILWVDIRIAFVMSFRAATTGKILPRSDVLRVFEEEVELYKKSPEGEGFWGARVIWTTIRIFNSETIRASMIECVETKKLYPGAVAGEIFPRP